MHVSKLCVNVFWNFETVFIRTDVSSKAHVRCNIYIHKHIHCLRAVHVYIFTAVRSCSRSPIARRAHTIVLNRLDALALFSLLKLYNLYAKTISGVEHTSTHILWNVSIARRSHVFRYDRRRTCGDGLARDAEVRIIFTYKYYVQKKKNIY